MDSSSLTFINKLRHSDQCAAGLLCRNVFSRAVRYKAAISKIQLYNYTVVKLMLQNSQQTRRDELSLYTHTRHKHILLMSLELTHEYINTKGKDVILYL